MKICSGCKKEKDLDEFPLRKYPNRTRSISRCYVCVREDANIRAKNFRSRRRLAVTPLRPA